MPFHKPIFYKILLVLLAAFISGCKDNRDTGNSENHSGEIWFKQLNVELGGKIKIFSKESGIAISKGKGENTSGELLLLNKGVWSSIAQFDYSDYPLIARYPDGTIWYLIHLTHNGNYKPELYSVNGKITRKLDVPEIMWDEKDYCMWRGLSVLKNGTAYLVGQKGNIAFFNGKNWEKMESPLLNDSKNNLMEGDLHDVQMFSGESGWAVGREGKILRYKNGKWSVFPSPTRNNLNSISMCDENFGWIVGDYGTILKFSEGKWNLISTEARVGLNSVMCVSKDKAWIAGNRSLLFEYADGNWVENKAIKIFEDNFNCVDVFFNDEGKYDLWVIGNSGIYSNKQSFNFSFTDITSQYSLRREGRFGVFADFNNDSFDDLVSVPENGPVLLYENRSGKSLRQTGWNFSFPGEKNSQIITVGDLNNDGNNDIIKILDDINYQLLFGKGDFSFRTGNKENLKLNYISTDNYVNSAALVDFNNDGNPDLYISNYNSPDMLFKNDGTGKFENIFAETGIIKYPDKKSFGAVFADFNNDNLVDILITYKIPEGGKYLSLFINEGNFRFSEKQDSLFYTKGSPNTYSAIADDFNCDGFTDIVVFNNDEKIKLLINKGDAAFWDATAAAGLDKVFSHLEPGNGILASGDINNDGYPDLFIGSKLFLNSPQLYFNEIGKYVGVNFTGNPTFADIDNDGDMDLYIGSSTEALGKGERTVLYRNNLPRAKFIKAALDPDISNRSGIGTKIFLERYDLNGKLINRYLKQAGLGFSPISQSVFSAAEFGIQDGFNYKLKIVFPSGIEKIIDVKETNKLYTVRESSFYRHYSILLLKSIVRTLLQINYKVELAKFLVLLIMFRLMYGYGLKTKAAKLIRKWYLAAAFIILYAVLVHLNINESFLKSSFISIGGTGMIAFAVIMASVYVYERKGRLFILHYHLIKEIGAGGMGKVYKAVDTRNNKLTALKVLNNELLKSEANRKVISAEGKILTMLEHPNIVKIYEFGETNEQAFIAMEYLEGPTLDEFICKNHPVDIDTVIRVASQILNGLNAIHSNKIIHRDLKSANIMFDGNNDIRIMDFGMSKSPLITSMTTLGTALGTLGFSAPEQVTNLEIDIRADIFSFGVILYHLLSSELPFKGENEISLIYSIFNTEPAPPSTINTGVPVEFDGIVRKCLEKEPKERYESAQQILTELEILKAKYTQQQN